MRGMLMAYKVESAFNTDLDDIQVESIYALIRNWKKQDNNTKRLHYIIATCWHESWLKPIEEIRGTKGTYHWSLQNKYWDTGFYGRGLIQLTWEYNYIKLGKKLNIPIYENPDLMLEPSISAAVTVTGCLDGDFTGVGLRRYINEERTDFYNARRVVNVLDRAEKIKEHTNKLIWI